MTTLALQRSGSTGRVEAWLSVCGTGTYYTRRCHVIQASMGSEMKRDSLILDPTGYFLYWVKALSWVRTSPHYRGSTRALKLIPMPIIIHPLKVKRQFSTHARTKGKHTRAVAALHIIPYMHSCSLLSNPRINRHVFWTALHSLN